MSFDVEYGQNGVFISAAGVTVADGDFYTIKALEDSVVEITSNWENGTVDQSVSLVNQGTLEGAFTKVTVVSGSVVCYE